MSAEVMPLCRVLLLPCDFKSISDTPETGLEDGPTKPLNNLTLSPQNSTALRSGGSTLWPAPGPDSWANGPHSNLLCRGGYNGDGFSSMAGLMLGGLRESGLSGSAAFALLLRRSFLKWIRVDRTSGQDQIMFRALGLQVVAAAACAGAG